ncbi:MAG: SCP2 sterol-binding domain-containing protein [Myxococcota bacterium]|nr:SCP2 sterol-binding domain-containing protein [Myxococcota bacterium]
MKPDLEKLEDFYAKRVPDHWNLSLEKQAESAGQGEEGAQRLLDDMTGVQATIDIIVESDASDVPVHYHLNIEAGRMCAGKDRHREPFLTLCHDYESFQVLEHESGDSILGFLGALAGQKDDLQLTPGRIQNLNGINGTLSFQLTGEKPMALEARFGGAGNGEETRCLVRLSRETYQDLKTGVIAPQDVFLNGLVEIEGDMQMAMQIALAAVAPS